ncbi:MAG: Do family serine endopeptidase [Planctomycetota bacterium]|jgi:serine protease Do
MQTLSFKKNKSPLRYFAISLPLVLLILIALQPAFAEDANSVDTLRQIGKTFTKIAGKASPAVVGIKAEKTITYYPTMPDWPFGDPFDPFEEDFFERFFRRRSPRERSPRERQPERKYQQVAQGSGFIISPDGYIITSNHLVGEADKVTVKLGEDPDIEATVAGRDPDSDVAVIKIERKDLAYLELADSDALEVGEWVIAIGNPFGLSHTVTAGIVSAKGRSGFRLATYEDFIQTDAAINPGNSGGPLLNLDGKVVGINTFIISRSGGNMGIGFAIPINMAKTISKELIETGKVVRGFLGVGIQDLDPLLAASFGLKEDTKGVLVPNVRKGSAAEKAGLKHGDVIVEFEGKPIEKGKELQKRVGLLKPGAKVKIVVLRDGKRKTLSVKLGERPSAAEIAGAPPEALEQLGFTVKDLTDELAERLGYEGLTGVIVSRVESGSEAAKKGIIAGTLIMEVNRAQVKNTKEFNKAVEKAKEKGRVLLLIRTEEYIRFIVLKLSKE